MSSPDGNSTLTLNDTDDDEDKMRAALGLVPERGHSGRPASAEAPRRSGRGPGGAYSVVRRPEADSSRARVAGLERDLAAERSERVAAQQALSDTQRLVQQLQTKLAHAEFAAAEALQAEQKLRLAAEAVVRDLAPAAPPKAAAEPGVAKRRGRPPGKKPVAELPEPEPEPVQWWLPSYAASKAKRPRSKI